MTISIHLDGSRLWIDPPLPVLADGTANKVRFRLSPDSDWDGLVITVIFRRVYAVGVDARKVVIGNVAAAYAIPHEVLRDGWLYIGAVGVAQNGEVRLTTAKMESPLKVSASEDGDADLAGSITPEVADQILALMGAVSNLDTTDKSSLVAAINEVLGKFGELDAADIAANVDGIPADNVAVALAYLLDQIGDLSTPIPIARGQSEDGAAYVAAGENLPDVKPGSNGKHEGKGKQIIFIPDRSSNTIESPTLQINGGDAAPIRMRAPKNQGQYESSPDATLPVPVGALMVGVPYTMTFCGMYWLVDSQIAQYACAEDQSQAELLRESARQLVSLSETDTIGMPIINSLDGVGTAKATIVRSETEDGNPDVSGNVTLPTEARVKEMTEACVVNMTKNADGTYTADKTFAALKAAHDAGKTVICSFDDRTNMWESPCRLPVVDTTDVHMGFAGVIEPRQNYKIFAYVYINSSGMAHTATEIATNDTVSTMIAAAIGDTATALSDMDSVIGGAGA